MNNAREEKSMNRNRLYQAVIALTGCFLIVFVAACGSSNTTTGGNTTATNTPSMHQTATFTASGNGSHNSTPATGNNTSNVPATSTNCPATGTARAGVFANLSTGSSKNIVYIVNTSPNTTPTGTLKRYDMNSGAKTEILNLPNTLITEAQISADGQWILFVAKSGSVMKLQLVRMDGQGLQTLFCSSNTIFDSQWSTNQQLIVFAVGGAPNVSTVDLLNVTTGKVQVEVNHITSVALEPRAWLDNTRVYLVDQPTDQPPDALYLLDTSRGPNQSASSLPKVYDANAANDAFCWNFDSSWDGTKLFTSQCVASDPRGGHTTQLGPTSIRSYPATGGSATTVLASTTAAITSVRSISNSLLIYTVDTIGGGTSQNGLWRVNANGSSAARLTATAGQLNTYSQFPWSNVSRDGNTYTLQVNSGNTNTLLYGSINGGPTTTFASISDGTQLAIVGWTML